MAKKANPLETGKFQYEALGIAEKPILVRAGNQMVAARKLDRARHLPRVWHLDLIENGETVEWWEFNDLAQVVVPRR